MFTAGFASRGIDAVYLAFDVAPEDLSAAVRGLSAIGVAGMNVTTPHKVPIMAWLDEVEDSARDVGAVNAIVREGSKLIGFNTDAEGLVATLRAEGVDLHGAHVVVLGAGGAAAACVFAAIRQGARSVHVAARRIEAARSLVERFSGKALAMSFGVIAELRPVFSGADVVLQATTATLSEEAHGLIAEVPWDALPKDAHVMDLAYGGRTDLLGTRCAAERLRWFDGRAMLAFQAAAAWTRWFGTEAPVETMRAAISDGDAYVPMSPG